ncbi:MAG: hypothetical protein LUC95_09410, partial [Lachnospiraceae bacterium]|nr:hypothetical protein [Lachnospiraceae bacterium]
LFPTLASDSEAAAYISANVIANMLGLGGAATPAGLKAMKALKQEQNGRTGRAPERLHRKGSKGMEPTGTESEDLPVVASDEMCDFLILNISSLQLIPVNMIAYRAQYGSVNPSWVIVPGLLATAVSTLAGILFIKVRRIWARRKHERVSAAHCRRWPVQRT